MGYYGFARYLPNVLPCNCGGKLRGFFCRMIFEKCGKSVNVERGVYFGTGRNIEIDDGSGIGRNTYIYGVSSGGRLVIGKNVMISPDTIILTLAHEFVDHKNQYDRYRCTTIRIGDWSWIGIRSILLPDVTIGECSIIGAGAVVSRDVPPYSVAVGVPARVVKTRAKRG